jgi:hypothetical protein
MEVNATTSISKIHFTFKYGIKSINKLTGIIILAYIWSATNNEIGISKNPNGNNICNAKFKLTFARYKLLPTKNAREISEKEMEDKNINFQSQ